MTLDTIIPYKDYHITILHFKPPKGRMEWYCAYAYLERLDELDKDEYIGDETYREGKVIGVDANHSWNETHTPDEKKEDAIRQMKRTIGGYEKLLASKSGDKKAVE